MLVPRKKTAKIAAIHPSVRAAFLELGFLNAPTPFEIASVPVIATQPSANPRRMRNTNANPSGVESVLVDAPAMGAAVAVAFPPAQTWYSPRPINTIIIAMKTYVGTLNAIPDSRTPRRLTTVSSTTAAMHNDTVCEMSDG